MKNIFLLLLLFLLLEVNVFSQTDDDLYSQLDIFTNIIPKYKSITITGSSQTNSVSGEIKNSLLYYI